MRSRLGLRGKSVLALAGTCVLILLLSSAAGWQALQSMRLHLGAGFTRNFTLLSRERILAPVTRELALSLRLADSQTVKQWLLDCGDGRKKDQALLEAESFRQAFVDKSYFLACAASNDYFFNDALTPYNAAPRYRLDPHLQKDVWFFSTMQSRQRYFLNIDPSLDLGRTKVWFNVVAVDGKRRIGLAGTGLDLTNFLRDFIGQKEAGVTPMIVDQGGAIQAHPDRSRIAFNAGTSRVENRQSLFGLLQGKSDADAARAALIASVAAPGQATVFSATIGGKRQLVGVSYIPELKWHVLAAVDLDAANVLDIGVFKWGILALLVLLAAVMSGFVYALDRMVLRPLFKLKQSAQEIAAGNYAVALPAERDDEIGDLTAAFEVMARKVGSHTEELEQTVRERTGELLRANNEMTVASRKIGDSIAYASLIQRAILPERQLAKALRGEHFVLWRPRDVVGGDFYVCRPGPDSCLLGVVDCAGHGVPGAFMTMLAHGAINAAIDEAGAGDPAGILARADHAMRTMLDTDSGPRDVATMMDAGLAYIDFAARRVVFSGAKIALFWSDGEQVEQLKGARRSLGDRKVCAYENAAVDLLPTRTFYLATDGFFDQAGGEHGFGFGNARFTDMLRRHARLPLAEQSAAFAAILAEYQGSHPQRDDITIVCFRF